MAPRSASGAARRLEEDDRAAALSALLAAPLSEQPETAEERASFEAMIADIEGGRRGVGSEEIRELIDQMRRDAGE